jgi:hypothetical protein
MSISLTISVAMVQVKPSCISAEHNSVIDLFPLGDNTDVKQGHLHLSRHKGGQAFSFCQYLFTVFEEVALGGN